MKNIIWSLLSFFTESGKGKIHKSQLYFNISLPICQLNNVLPRDLILVEKNDTTINNKGKKI